MIPPDAADSEQPQASVSRRHPRYEVELSVRYFNAQEYVEQYAYSLSEGGLFVADVEMEPMAEVSVEIELPGYGKYRVRTRVAYVLGAEEAIKSDQKPGAGLAIIDSPEGFDSSLKQYLLILGRRKDSHVLVSSGLLRKLLDIAGYQTADAPPAEEIAAVIQEIPFVVGVVVTGGEAPAYRKALAAADLPVDLTVEVGTGSSAYQLLNTLDQRVSQLIGDS